MGNKTDQARAALLIYIEPTPYVLGLIRCIANCSEAPVEALFVTANVSQPWNLTLRDASASYLPMGTFVAALEIAKKLSTGQYGLLHLAGWGHPTLLLVLLLGWHHRIPVFLESDTPLPLDLPLWKRAFKRLFYPYLFRIPAKVLPGGRRQTEYLRHYGVSNGRLVTAHMTVDVAEIMRCSDEMRAQGDKPALRRKFGLSESQTVYIFVGRLETYKGIGSLLEAFGAVTQTRSDVALLIVGDGCERMQVEAAARENNFVKYAGRLEPDDVIQAYVCADIALVPSTFEPWGLVVNEAMAVGLPVIASDRVGCVDDLVRHGETGLVFPSGSAEKLGESMLYLLENPETRTEMGEAGRRLISGWTLEEQARITVEAWRLGVDP